MLEMPPVSEPSSSEIVAFQVSLILLAMQEDGLVGGADSLDVFRLAVLANGELGQLLLVDIDQDEFGEVDGVGGHALAAGHGLALIDLARRRRYRTGPMRRQEGRRGRQSGPLAPESSFALRSPYCTGTFVWT